MAEAESDAAALPREADTFVDSRMASFESVLALTTSQVRTARARLAERSRLDRHADDVVDADEPMHPVGRGHPPPTPGQNPRHALTSPHRRLDRRSGLVLDTHDLSRRCVRDAGMVQNTVPAPKTWASRSSGFPRAPRSSSTSDRRRWSRASWSPAPRLSSCEGECVRCLTGSPTRSRSTSRSCSTYPGSVSADEEASHLDGALIDLEPVLPNVIVLELLFQPVCRARCLGLCPDCGLDRNTVDEHDDDDVADPRGRRLRSSSYKNPRPNVPRLCRFARTLLRAPEARRTPSSTRLVAPYERTRRRSWPSRRGACHAATRGIAVRSGRLRCPAGHLHQPCAPREALAAYRLPVLWPVRTARQPSSGPGVLRSGLTTSHSDAPGESGRRCLPVASCRSRSGSRGPVARSSSTASCSTAP